MRRAFIYTVTFSAIFLALLAVSAYFLGSMSKRALYESDASRIEKEAYLIDDLSTDFQDYLGASIGSSQNRTANRTSITVHDSLPCAYSSCQSELAALEQFASLTYPVKTNVNTTMNASAFRAAPEILFMGCGLRYSYDSLGKNWVCFHGTNRTRNYTLNAVLGRQMTNYSNGTWAWSGTPTGLYVSLNITDALGTEVLVQGQKAGYIDPAAENIFWVNAPGGYMTVAAGATGYGDYSLNLSTSGLGVTASTTAILEGDAPVVAWAPVRITAGNSTTFAVLRED